MKILCVTPTYWPAFEFGGPIQSLHLLNKGLIRNGASIDVFTTNKGQSSEVNTKIEINMDGINVTYFPYSKYLEFLGTTGWHFSYPLLKALKAEIKNYKIVYILSIWNFTSAITAYYCKKFNIPYVISPRGQLYDQVTSTKKWKKLPYYKLIASRILTNAKAVHYTSEDEYLNVHERLGLKNSALIVPNGIVMDEYSNLPKKGEFIKLYPHLKNQQILLYLGRLSWKKGIDLIIKSLPTILAKNKNAHLVIAGNEEDNYKNELINVIKSTGLKYCDTVPEKPVNVNQKDTSVTFTGYLDNVDKKKLMVDSKLFLLSSHSENFGMSVVEAMACGLPVVISKNVGIAEKVLESNAGIVIENNKNELSEQINKLMENKERTELLRNNALTLIKEEFEINKVSKKLLVSLELLINENGKILN